MAILKRGKQRHFLKNIRETVWPSQGWGRTFHYYRHRVFRTGDSTYKITAGLASGVAVSWSPLMGTHFAQAVFLSWMLRANLLAGFIGTAFGNPWTFPFLFWVGYETGVRICGLFGLSDFIALPPRMDLAFFTEQPWEFMHYLFAHPFKLLLPMTIGGYLWAILTWPVAYAVLYYPVRAARKAYKLQKFRRIKGKKSGKEQEAR